MSALQYPAGRGRSGAVDWQVGEGAGPFAGGSDIALLNLSVCTRGPRGCAAGELRFSPLSIYADDGVTGLEQDGIAE